MSTVPQSRGCGGEQESDMFQKEYWAQMPTQLSSVISNAMTLLVYKWKWQLLGRSMEVKMQIRLTIALPRLLMPTL